MALPGSSAALLDRARAAWRAALAALGAGADAAAATLAGLETRYGERHRAYHTLAHVSALVDLAETHRERLASPPEVILAIWYHDAIYLPRRGDNEEASAGLARAELDRNGIAPAAVTRVEKLVVATRTHEPPAGLPDGPAFLDFDLSILGSDPAVYHEYAEAIRREFWWVPERTYRRNRSLVLERFLARPRIYLTDWLRDRLETRARANLAAELAA